MRWEICDFAILRNGFRQNVIKFLGFARAPLWYDVKTLKCLFNTYHIIFYFSTFSLAEPTQNALATSVTTRTDRTGWKRSFFLSLSSSYSSAPRPLQTRRRRSGSRRGSSKGRCCRAYAMSAPEAGDGELGLPRNARWAWWETGDWGDKAGCLKGKMVRLCG